MQNNNNILILIAALLIGILGALMYNAPSHRDESAGDKISNGIHQVGEGIEDAARGHDDERR